MIRLFGWMRLGVMDLRGDLRRFGVLIACLALGTSVIAAVGSVGAGLRMAIERDASVLMGGDLELSREDRAATDDELAFIQSLGSVTHVVDATTRGRAGDNTALIDLVAVDDKYPLLGAVESPQLTSGDDLAALLAQREGSFGTIFDAVLLDRLGVNVGDHFRLDNRDFVVRGTLTSLPDGASRGFKLGLTALISIDGLVSLGEFQPPLPGLVSHYKYKLVLAGMSYQEAAAAITAQFNDPLWHVRSPRDAAGNLVRYYDLFSRFMLIVGLSSLLVGGVGVSNSVSAYIGERQRSIAILRSLGATSSRILVHFLTQIGVLTAIGVGLGVAAGAAASLFLLPFVGRTLDVNLPPVIDPVPLLAAAGFGVLAGFAYSYMPLVRAQKVSPALLFRSQESEMPPPDWLALARPSAVLPIGLAAAAIFALAVQITNDIALVTYYAIGAAFSFLFLRVAGWALQKVLRPLPNVRLRSVRHALRNIYAPGSTAPVVVVSVGLGLAMLLVIVLLESNLYDQLLGAATQDAPALVVTDLFDDEVTQIEELARQDGNLTEFVSTPMLRGAVTGINGADPAVFKCASEECAFILSGDVPVTWLRDAPANAPIVEGSWWPQDYDGAPQVSLHLGLKSALGVEVGDSMQFMLFGEPVDATIANFRDYPWQQGIDFLVAFSPGQIESYPSTFLGAIKVADGRQKDVERLLNRTLPDVAFIPVGDALNQLASALGQLGLAVNVVGVLAVTNGLFVLIGTLAAGRKRREADAVIQKVLGATRADILGVFILEYSLLGSFAALIATIIGIGSAWVITQSTLNVGFATNPSLIGAVVAGTIILTTGAGALTTWRTLSTRPAQFLRIVT